MWTKLHQKWRWLGGTLLGLLLLVSAPQAQSSGRNAGGEYRVKVGDKLSLRFLHQPEWNELAVVVRPDGMIALQIVEEIRAAGLTAAELKRVIEKAYSEILREPVVTVSLLEFVAPRVFVSGQVAKPGSYELRSGQTLWQAIALAGGCTRDAHRTMVLHARPGADRTLKVTVVDINQLLAPNGRQSDLKSDLQPDLQLEDGDYVFIPDSKLARFSRVVEAFRALVPGFRIN